MKKFLKGFVFMLAVLVATSVSAQELKEKVKVNLQKEVDQMGEFLKLNADQKARVLQLKIEYFQSKEKAGQQNAKGTDGYKAAMKEIGARYNTGFAEACTKEQLKLWKEEQKKQAEARKLSKKEGSNNQK